ncbi:hypothetical protein BC941DRAFT_444756 [Chlamydoabsidia padenii]|nr:hypothetical protein BC941DRAFT_444756 [Chlamydoabsidia padenii]
METCVLPLSTQTKATEQDTEQENQEPTIHQPIDDNSLPTAITINTRKSSTMSLSDLIPGAAEALRTRQHLQQTTSNNDTLTLFHDSSSTSSLCNNQPVTNATPFARALTKVKLQVQTKRLKERYLSHEWIRLALGLPVDLSRINLHHCYSSQERLDDKNDKTAGPQNPINTSMALDTSSLSPSYSPPPSPAPSNTTSSGLLNSKKDAPINIPATPPVSPSRTGEIATWYEWKIDRSKFSVDEVQTKVDRLRTTKLRDRTGIV